MCYGKEKFNEKGVELQMNANNWWQSKRNYLYSCMLCCMQPGMSDCEHCPIREAMLTNARIFKNRMPVQELNWVEKERELQ